MTDEALIRRLHRKDAPATNSLPEMRERAKRIGANINVWTGNEAATEIELGIPGSIACVRGSAPQSAGRQ